MKLAHEVAPGSLPRSGLEAVLEIGPGIVPGLLLPGSAHGVALEVALELPLEAALVVASEPAQRISLRVPPYQNAMSMKEV